MKATRQRMTKEHQYALNTYVKLRDGVDSVYALAAGGSPAWIRKQRVDHPDIPMVYVEWDQNYWAYQGEPDQWTFETHFVPMEESMADDGFKIDGDELIAFLENQKVKQSGGSSESAKPSIPPEPKADMPTVSPEEYAKELSHASETAIDADAFIVISVKHVDNEGDNLQLIPHVSQAYRTEQAGYLCEAQMAQVVSDLVLSTNMKHINRILKEQSGE